MCVCMYQWSKIAVIFIVVDFFENAELIFQ